MKKIIKLFGIISFILSIGLNFTVCNNGTIEDTGDKYSIPSDMYVVGVDVPPTLNLHF